MSRFKAAFVSGALMVSVASAVALSATTASAEVACNRLGECWHVHEHIAYPAELGVVWHPEGWHARHYHWRHDRFDHGYYRNGVWVAF